MCLTLAIRLTPNEVLQVHPQRWVLLALSTKQKQLNHPTESPTCPFRAPTLRASSHQVTHPAARGQSPYHTRRYCC